MVALAQKLTNFSLKGQMLNSLDFAGQTVSVATTQLSHRSFINKWAWL